MNTLCLFSHCGNHFPPQPFEGCVFNHPSVMSCLIWAIAVVIIAFMAYCYLKRRDKSKLAMKELAQKHELAMKEKVFEQEKFWYFQKELKKDFQKELNEKIQKLEDEKNKLSEDLAKEKKDRNDALKKERLQAEHDFYEKILKTFYKINDSQRKK